jgi:signal transduction histidine kinase
VSTRLHNRALRIALITIALVAGLLVALCVAVDVIVAQTLRSSATDRLTSELTQLAHQRGTPTLQEPDVDDPVLVWNTDGSGTVIGSTAGAPPLPRSAVTATSPVEMRLEGADVLVAGVSIPGGRLIGAVSLGNESKTLTALLVTESIVGPILLVFVFAGAFVVGRQTAGPIERARRRQLEFTADASHELRTPLAVIEAETSLALTNLESAGADDPTLRRVADETRRMRSIVEDLLWLARFDALPPDPITQPVDIVTAADVGAQRFVPVAEHAGLHLEHRRDGAALALVDAPPDWIDRLVGVLLDNACRYTPTGGRVGIEVEQDRDHVRLTVSDTGPGIPPERQARIFERFRRGTSDGDGAGLGLAIGNAIVEATRGRWQIADVPGGGTSVSVVWPHSRTRLVDRIES